MARRPRGKRFVPMTPPPEAVLLLSAEDEHLRELCAIVPRTGHKRAGVQMWHAVMVRTVAGRRRSRRRAPPVYRLIMQRALGVRRLPRGMHVDHINGNPLDNRRDNLRMATPMQNSANAHKRPGCSSKYKGVSWDKRAEQWRAELNLTGRSGSKGTRLLLGRFDSEIVAGLCYDQVAREWYGEFARLNFPEQYTYVERH